MARLLAFILCATLFLMAPAKADWTQYDPVIRIGTPTGWKNILFVIWNHNTKGSAWAQRDILRKLAPEITGKVLTVMLYQIAGPDEEELRQASLFLCVPKDHIRSLLRGILTCFLKRGARQAACGFRDCSDGHDRDLRYQQTSTNV